MIGVDESFAAFSAWTHNQEPGAALVRRSFSNGIGLSTYLHSD
jgi:hypothetical protein